MTARSTEVTVWPYRFLQVPEGDFSRRLYIYDLDSSGSEDTPLCVITELDQLQQWFESL